MIQRWVARAMPKSVTLATMFRSLDAPLEEAPAPRVAGGVFIAGNWVPELVESAGGHDVLGVTGEHSPWTSWDTLLAADPDRIVVMPCGFDIERTRGELSSVVDRSEWNSLRAVAEDRVVLVDGHAFFNRPGPRLVDSAVIHATESVLVPVTGFGLKDASP